jgi:hypothetical protein
MLDGVCNPVRNVLDRFKSFMLDGVCNPVRNVLDRFKSFMLDGVCNPVRNVLDRFKSRDCCGPGLQTPSSIDYLCLT